VYRSEKLRQISCCSGVTRHIRDMSASSREQTSHSRHKTYSYTVDTGNPVTKQHNTHTIKLLLNAGSLINAGVLRPVF